MDSAKNEVCVLVGGKLSFVQGCISGQAVVFLTEYMTSDSLHLARKLLRAWIGSGNQRL